MARVVILGAGVSGHTAALYLKKWLGKSHEVLVISPNSKWNWIPSNIWVGIGKMTTEQVTFPLAPVYKRKKISFKQALATEIWPEGDAASAKPKVKIQYTDPNNQGTEEFVEYDYLINATGPKLNFAATEGLGPDNGYTVSVCTPTHAVSAAAKLAEVISSLKADNSDTKKKIIVGVGHGTCTCEGAAFEYTFNVEHELSKAGVRQKTDLIFLTNENELGDFGVGGMVFEENGYQTTSQLWTESLFRERNVQAITGAAVTKITPETIFYDQIDGSHNELSYDFAMLLPPFRGADLKAFDPEGNEITDKIFAPSGFMKVDADYTPRPYAEWTAKDWPSTYQNPSYGNMFAIGIAFAPPHQISIPRATPDGVAVAPAPPRTGMPSGTMGKVVARSISDMVLKGASSPTHKASMAELAAACVASTGKDFRKGTAAAMMMSPVVPDFEKYPETGGRHPKETFGEIGLAGHWVKRLLHTMFIYKAKGYPFWSVIPE